MKVDLFPIREETSRINKRKCLMNLANFIAFLGIKV